MTVREKRYKKKALKYYKDYYLSHQQVIQKLLSYFEEKKELIAVWGAGMKGTAFLELFDSDMSKIACVYDISDEKNGTKMLTGHNICKLQDKKYEAVKVILLMNNNYETEVAGMLRENRIEASLINIDSVILGKMSLKDIIDMYGGVI